MPGAAGPTVPGMSYGDLALSAQGAGALMSVFSTFAGASAQRAQMRFQADMADINAQVSEQAAVATLMAGQRQEQAVMLAAGKLKSSQTAAIAANGIDVGVGSAAHAIASTDLMGKIDANTVHANAVRSAWGYRTQATNFENEATMARSRADAINPTMAAASGLLTSATQLAGNWYTLNKGGALDAFASSGPRNYGRGDR